MNGMIRLLVVWGISVFVCLSCVNREQQTQLESGKQENVKNRPVNIHLAETGNDQCPISLMAKSIEYIPLETQQESFFKPQGVRNKAIRFKDSLIILSDGDRILVFNRNGKFIRRIGKTGKGPGEHLRIYGFDINRDTLYCSSTGTRKIIKYTLEGKYIEETNLKSQAVYFRSLGDKGFAWYDRHKGNIVYFDKMWHITDTLQVEYNVSPKRYKWSVSVPDEYYLYSINDRLLFNNYRNDTIWEVTDKKRKPAIIFDLKDKVMPREFTFWNMDGDWNKYKEIWGKYERVHPLYGDSTIVIIQYDYAYSRELIHVYNKNRKITSSFSEPLVDDLNGSISLSSWNIIQDNKIVLFLSFEEIEKQYEDIESEEGKTFLKVLLDKVKNMNGNPVMVIIEIK